MKLIETEPEFSFNPIHDYTTDEFLMSAGRQLQADLGLSRFGRNVTIQKVIGIGLPIYLITFNSKYPNVNLSAVRVKNIKSTWFGKVKRKAVHTHLKPMKLTPPLQLSTAMMRPVSGSLLLLRDIAGEILRNPKVFECVEVNNKLAFKESK